MFQGYEAVKKLLEKQHVCVAVTDKLKKDSGVARSVEYDKTVRKLRKPRSARGQCDKTVRKLRKPRSARGHFEKEEYRVHPFS